MPRILPPAWKLVAGVFVVLAASAGFGFYNLSVYMNVLAAERGFAVASLSLAISLFFLVGGAGGMAVARWVERHDVRGLMLAAALASGGLLAGLAYASAVWHVYLVYLLFGLCNSGMSIVIGTTLITRWFPHRNRAVALAMASTGLSVGGIDFTPLSAWLLNRYGLAAAMPWLGGLLVLTVVPVVLLLIRSWPPAAAPVGCISHLYNRVEEIAGLAGAAGAVQILAASSIIARLVGGALLARVPVGLFTVFNAVLQGVGLAVLALAPGTLLGAGIFGATVGNLLMLQPLWLADSFGVTVYARIFALSQALTMIGLAAGPGLLGVLFEQGGYDLSYLAATGLSAAAAAAFLAAYRGPQPRR